MVSIFPNRDSLTRLAGALLIKEHEEWSIGRRYISETSMKRLCSREEEVEELSEGASKLLSGTIAA